MRLDYMKTSPEGMKAVMEASRYLKDSKIEPALQHLVELRVSQINGCSYCIDMHLGQLRKLGIADQKLDLLSVWREVPFYTKREAMALEWAEAVTLLADADVPDELFEEVNEVFKGKDMFDLNLVVANMNLMNRIAIPFRKLPDLRK